MLRTFGTAAGPQPRVAWGLRGAAAGLDGDSGSGEREGEGGASRPKGSAGGGEGSPAGPGR